MRIFFHMYLTLILILVFNPSHAQRASSGENDTSNEKIEKLENEFTLIARDNNIETAKNYCIKFWVSSPDRIEVLSKFATVGEHCKCVEDEMKYLVSDELSRRLLNMQIQGNEKSLPQIFTKEETLAITQEWMRRFDAGSQSCAEKFLRRKHLQR